jgi:hypothetical protein
MIAPMYNEEKEITNAEGSKLLKSPDWIMVGERLRNLSVYWNKATGEIMWSGFGKNDAYCYFIRQKGATIL